MDSLYIAGVDCTNYVQIETPDWEFQLNTRATFEMEFLDTSGALRPELNDEVIYTKSERNLTVSISASNIVVTASVGLFAATDEGKVIVIPGAGPAAADLHVKILTFLSSSQVEVEFAAGTTVSGVVARVGERVFLGTINDYEERPFFADSGIHMRITCEDFNAKAELVLFNGISVGPTLRDHVDASLISGLTGGYGVVRDPAMATGPTLGVLGFNFKYVMEIWKELSRISGWVFYVDQVKVVRWVEVGTIVAPISLDETLPLAGTIKITKSYNQYRNSQWVWFGGSAQAEHTETETGDDVTTAWGLEGAPVGGFPSRGYVTVTISGSTFDLPIGLAGASTLEWTYNPTTNQLMRSFPLATGDSWSLTYLNQFPLVANVSDSAEILAHGLRSNITQVDEITTRADAEAYGNDLLRRYARTPRKISFDTYNDQLKPGMTVTVNLPNRGITGEDFLIDSVSSRDDGSGSEDEHIIYTISMIEGEEFQNLWIEFFRDQNGGSLGGATGSPGVPPSATTSDFPVVVATTQQAVNTAATNYPINLPAHDIGDLLVVYIGHSSHNDLSINAASSTPGWTELVNGSVALSLPSVAVYYKFATTNAELLTITNATSNTAQWVAWRVVNARSIQVSAAITRNPQGTTTDPANLISAAGIDNYLWVTILQSTSGTNGTITAPTGFGNMTRVTSSSASQTSLCVARREERSASKDPGVWSHTNQVAITYTLAIRPRADASNILFQETWDTSTLPHDSGWENNGTADDNVQLTATGGINGTQALERIVPANGDTVMSRVLPGVEFRSGAVEFYYKSDGGGTDTQLLAIHSLNFAEGVTAGPSFSIVRMASEVFRLNTTGNSVTITHHTSGNNFWSTSQLDLYRMEFGISSWNGGTSYNADAYVRFYQNGSLIVSASGFTLRPQTPDGVALRRIQIRCQGIMDSITVYA
jgi:hypothetical protein